MEKVKKFLKEFPSMSVAVIAYHIGITPGELQSHIDGAKPMGARLLKLVNVGIDSLRKSLPPNPR